MHGRFSRTVLFATTAIVGVEALAVTLEHEPVLLPGWRSDATFDMPETHAEVAADVPFSTMTAGPSGGSDITISPPTGGMTFTAYPPNVVNSSV